MVTTNKGEPLILRGQRQRHILVAKVNIASLTGLTLSFLIALLIAFAKDMVMLYNVPPSTIMGSCRGCSSIQLPFGLFLCLLYEAKQHRKTEACIIRKSFLIYLYASDMIFPKNDPIALY
ncbi:hypothetical protein Lal_00003478 [Lupinus albus]|nr:hypothetical protein Lal_00003478 [Lupinus albus]